MNYYSIICALLFVAMNINAQEGMIKYRQVWNHKPGQQNSSKGQLSYLYFKNDKSLYVYNRSRDIFNDKYSSGEIRRASTQMNFDYSDELGNMFYKDFTTSKLLIRQLVVGSAFISEEPMPVIEWKIISGEKDIEIFLCKKATTFFRGREYTAWFAPCIPLKNGPWKFHGLPGLIMEVYDKNKEIHFLAEVVTVPYNTSYDLLIPDKGKPVSFEEFKFIEIKQGQKLIDSLKTAFNITGNNQIRLDYYPIEKWNN